MQKQLYMNGEWVEGQQFADLYSPHTKELLAQIPQATAEQVTQAIDYAEAARVEISKFNSTSACRNFGTYCSVI